MASLSWNEVAPGKWQRSLDATERFFKFVSDPSNSSGRENWTINAIARLRFVDDHDALDSMALTDRLRNAWLWTRHEAPFIAALLEHDENVFTYDVPDQSKLASWLEQSFHVHTKEDSAATVDEYLDQVKPARYSSVHYFPSSSELVLRVHHWLNNAPNSLNTLDVFLRSFSQDKPAPSFGDEARRLTLSLSEAAGFPVHPSAQAQEQAQGMFLSFAGNLPSVGFPINSSPTQGLGGTGHSMLAFPSNVTDQLVAKCREHGFTVTSAVHAALILSLHENSTPATAGCNYTSVLNIDYRPYIQPQYSDAKTWPMGSYTICPPISLPPNTDFLAAARIFQQAYHQPMRQGETLLFDAYNTYTNAMRGLFATPLPDGVPPPTQPILSSLGRIDTKLQSTYASTRKVDLLDVEIVTDIAGPDNIVYCWSRDNKFYLSVNFNKSFYQTQWVQNMLEHVSRTLFKELDVSV